MVGCVIVYTNVRKASRALWYFQMCLLSIIAVSYFDLDLDLLSNGN